MLYFRGHQSSTVVSGAVVTHCNIVTNVMTAAHTILYVALIQSKYSNIYEYDVALMQSNILSKDSKTHHIIMMI